MGKYTIAIFDEQKRLIGKDMATKPGIDPGDLPVDGSYKYDEEKGCFLPVGAGFGKPKRSPVSDDQVLYILAKAMVNPPAEITEWLKWYDANIEKRNVRRRK